MHLSSRGLVLPAGAPALPKAVIARAWILADLDTGEVLAARDPHGRYQPASILKMLTALTVLPKLPGRRVVTVSRTAAAAEGSAVGLLAGAKYTVDDLFHALMMVSANDAAAALAEASGGVRQTVAAMNAEVQHLGGYDTFVQTPSGLDGWQQLTSAYDMALVLRAAMAQPRLIGYDQLPSTGYPAKASRYGKVAPYEFDNQSENFLATVPGAVLAKTGYTDAAQHTYLAAARRDGRTLGVVFLRDERVPLDQFQQAGALFDWGFALKPDVQPVGELAGPISPGATVRPRAAGGVSSAPASAGVSNAAEPARFQRRGIDSLAIIGGIGGLLALGGAVVAVRRGSRRRAPRRR